VTTTEAHPEVTSAVTARNLDAERCLAAGDLDGALAAARSGVATDVPAPAHLGAVAVLALALALRGETAAALGRAGEVAATSPVPRLVEAICASMHGRVPPVDLVPPVPADAPAVLRCTASAVWASVRARPGRAAVAAPGVAADPLAGAVFVAHGVLDVVGTDGTLVLPGGPCEDGVRRARYALAMGAARAAGATAARVLDRAGAHPRTRCEAAVLASLGATAGGDHDRGVHYVQMALACAGRTGAWAPIVSHGGLLVPAINEVARASSPLQNAAIEALERLRHDRDPSVVEDLTDRERTVLRFLPTLMSNEEIAGEMHVSVNTVKTHLKALYRKLGVRRRRDAVLRARERNLL
jgi:DNA-binding CsgD family transcriptional regulator